MTWGGKFRSQLERETKLGRYYTGSCDPNPYMKRLLLHSLSCGPYNRASSTFILLWASIEGVLLVSLIVVYIKGLF
jgi:hypothetical protein